MKLKKLIFSAFFVVPGLVTFAQDKLTYPEFNFSDWPSDVRKSFDQMLPEIKKKSFSENDLNIILKKVNTLYSFDNLKIIEKENQLYLVGTLTSKVSELVFKSDSSDVNSDDLKSIITLSLEDAENENKVAQSIEKMKGYYKNLGYRNAKISFKYETNNSLNRNLVFEIKLGQKTVISHIQVTGIDAVTQKEIEKQIYWYGIGDILSDDKIKALTAKVRYFVSQNGYFLVQVQAPQIFYSADDSEARLVFKLQARPKYKIEIVGAKSYSNLFLANDVLNLENYFSTENNFGAELSEKLRQFYYDKGFSLFEVSYYERKQNDTIILTLNVDEGDQILIENILIKGQLSRPESFYKDQFFKLSSQKIHERLWIRSEADQSGKNLITSLQNEGFISAKLIRIDTLKNSKFKNKIDLIVFLEEGPRTYIETIEIQNNTTFSRELLLSKIGLTEDQPLNLNQLEKALSQLKTFYAENGFIEVQITNEKSNTEHDNLVTYSSDFSKARITITLSEGVPITVGSIVLYGNKLTHDKLILTELDFKPGDILTPQKIEESVSRLQKTGHFASIDIYSLEPNSTVRERTVVIKLTERKPILLTFGLGATNENERTFHAYGGLAHRNFGGWGRGLSGRAELNYNDVFLKFLEKKITLGYLEPYLFDTRTRFRINYTTQVNVTNVTLRKQTIANSVIWSLEQDFTSHVTGIWDVYNITNYVEKGMTTQDEIDNSYSGQDYVIAATGPTLDIDFRDQILNPQKGHFSRLSLEFASGKIGSNKVDDYLRLTGQTTLYIPFSENKVVWANSMRGGYTAPVGTLNEGIPYDKKGFILGGRSTIRGFESNEFFPTSSSSSPEALGANYRFTTPTTYQLIKSELRFPFSSKQEVSAALFYDGGRVTIDGVHFEDSYRDSFGIGLRYATPVGPLNLEYAHKLDRKPYESEGAFHLSVGVF